MTIKFPIFWRRGSRVESEYLIGDALGFLRKMQGQGLKGVATSPPYNKAFKGRGKSGHSNWNSKLMSEGYAHYDDNMPEEDYIAWQRAIIQASLDCVGRRGVLVYNIGRKIKNLHEDWRERIVEGFPVRQVVIWNRGSTHNQGGKRPSILPPIYELIYVIAGKKWRLPRKHLAEFQEWGDVWRINPERKNPHPAPFPMEIATRMAKLIDGPLADPFAGSGTMGLAALSLGLAYKLNDLSPEYRDMFNKRKADHLHHEEQQLALAGI